MIVQTMLWKFGKMSVSGLHAYSVVATKDKLQHLLFIFWYWNYEQTTCVGQYILNNICPYRTPLSLQAELKMLYSSKSNSELLNPRWNLNNDFLCCWNYELRQCSPTLRVGIGKVQKNLWTLSSLIRLGRFPLVPSHFMNYRLLPLHSLLPGSMPFTELG